MALSKIDLDKAGVTGTLPTSNLDTVGVAQGGTGITSGTTDQFLKFTGSTTIASAADNAGTFDKLLGGSAGSAVNHEFTGFIDNTKYDNYLVQINNLVGTLGNDMRFQFGDSGGWEDTSNYWYAAAGFRSSDNTISIGAEGVGAAQLGSAFASTVNAPASYLFYLYLKPENKTFGNSVYGHSWGYRSDLGDYYFTDYTLSYNVAITVTKFRIYASGNDATTFDYVLYGIKK
tara:strand:+ start:20710 stop:21402 length:693 start_codon:yes stop_codon:yes gene_type:complete